MGLLDQAQAPAMPPPTGAAPAAPQSPMVDVGQAQAQAKQKMDKLKRLVMAGQKILYTPPASEHFLKFINPEHLPESVGEVAAMIIAVLIDKGREEGAPPELVMPAGVTIVGDLLSYASEVFGVQVDDAITKAAIKAFLDAMTRGVQQGQALQQTGQPAQAAAPGQPPQPQAQGVMP